MKKFIILFSLLLIQSVCFADTRVKVSIMDVTCHNSQAEIGNDEFYMITRNSKQKGAQHLPNLSISHKGTRLTGRRPDTQPYNHLIFDGILKDGDSVDIFLAANESDSSPEWIDTVITNLIVAETGAPQEVPEILRRLFDGDEKLGNTSFTVPAQGPSEEAPYWNFDGHDWSTTWKYAVRYKITREAI